LREGGARAALRCPPCRSQAPPARRAVCDDFANWLIHITTLDDFPQLVRGHFTKPP